MVPDLTRELLEGESLYTILKRQYHYQLGYARQTIEPIRLNEFESNLLAMQNHSLDLLFRRTTFLRTMKCWSTQSASIGAIVTSGNSPVTLSFS